MLSTASDNQLFNSLHRGDQIAFSELYDRHKVMLHSHAYKKLGDLEEAKDLVQEIFITLWNKRDIIADVKNPTAYLHRMLRNRILDVIAHKKVQTKYLDSLNTFISEANYTTDITIREKEFRLFLDSIINDLPFKMREVFMMSRNTGKTHKQIAEELGVTESTVKNHIKAALKVFRQKLGFWIYLYFTIFF